MSDVSLVPVDHQPDFDGVSLVPVEHDPFSDDIVTQQTQAQPAQTPPAQPQPQQQAPGAGRIHVGVSPNKTQASEVGESWNPDTGNNSTSEPSYSAASTTAQGTSAYDWSRYNQPSGELKPATFTPTQQIGYLAADALMAAGMQPYTANDLTSRVGGLLGLTPVGTVGSALDFIDAAHRGDLPGALVAAAGMIPGPKGAGRVGARIAADAIRDISRSSRILGNALEAAGQVRRAGDEAHHIVAKKATAADPARITLQKFGIGLHDAANGVFLPRPKHRRLHGNEYYEAVNKALARAKSKAEAEQILQSIAQGLQSGTFP
jgi:hypothetical protein